MKIHRTMMMWGLAAVAASTFGPETSARVLIGPETIKLNGCLVKADSGDGYLITNMPSDPATSTADKNVATGSIGTSEVVSTVFYWLGDHGALKDHVGHRVEIEGELKGDIKDGEIKIDRKDNWTELKVKSDGHEMKAEVPNAYVFPYSTPDKDRKISVLVRKVDVDHVKMISADCR